MQINTTPSIQNIASTNKITNVAQPATASIYTEADRLKVEREFAAKVVFGGALPEWEAKGLDVTDELIDNAVFAMRSAMQQAIANDQPPGALVFNKLAILHDSQVEVPDWLIDVFETELEHYSPEVQEALRQGELHVHIPSQQLAELAEASGKDPRDFGAYKGINISA